MRQHSMIFGSLLTTARVLANLASRVKWATVWAVCSIAIAPVAVGAPITVPMDLNPGDEYRLAFITSASRDATSGSIDDYNTFVTNVANTQPALSDLGTTWKAIASTSSVIARDNTGTNFFIDFPNNNGVPIYLLDGITKIADDSVDLWNDGALDAPLNVNEAGVVVTPTDVWTGSSQFGSAQSPLGVTNPLVGRSDAANSQWMFLGQSSRFASHPLYALSDVLTAIPEPPAYLWGLAAIAFIALRQRLA